MALERGLIPLQGPRKVDAALTLHEHASGGCDTAQP